MIDTVTLIAIAGRGGKGSAGFRREKFVPRGGPDGGDGGKGGDVYLQVDGSLNTLLHLRYVTHCRAGEGGDGGGRQKTGAYGRSFIVLVPPGTRVWRGDGEEKILVDLTGSGQEWCAAKGGSGGRGNIHF
ncbi:MAG: GTPase ObgE, partial [Dehalococcoidia bacterium]|nr:GTPase ObgE [Dehalococcoidia bacterium]